MLMFKFYVVFVKPTNGCYKKYDKKNPPRVNEGDNILSS